MRRCSRSSSRSGATTRARPRARGLASPLRGASSSCMAAKYGWTAPSARAPLSPSPYRYANEGARMSTVLIVEDNDKNMKLARDVLQAKGYQTLEAITGEEGVKLAREKKPDLVLMDIQLPGINGIEAFRQIRAHENTKGIPVVALTA